MFVLKPFGLKKHLDISKSLTFNHFDFEADFIFNFGSAVRKCNNRENNVEIYINVTLVQWFHKISMNAIQTISMFTVYINIRFQTGIKLGIMIFFYNIGHFYDDTIKVFDP